MTRISKEEMLASVVKAKNNEPSKIDQTDREAVAYSDNGVEVPEKHKDAYVKAIRLGDRISYFALRGPNNKLFNPYDDPTYDNNHRYRHKDNLLQKYQFRETTKKIFDLYLQYLETRNRAYLLNAEREQ